MAPVLGRAEYGFAWGRFVQELRRRAKLTQGALAQQLGTSQSTLCRIEQGGMFADVSLARDIARIFALRFDELDEAIEEAWSLVLRAAEKVAGPYLSGPEKEVRAIYRGLLRWATATVAHRRWPGELQAPSENA